jgi:hypothetical protein
MWVFGNRCVTELISIGRSGRQLRLFLPKQKQTGPICDVEPAPSLFVIADSMCRLHRIATHFPSWYANKDRLQEENLIVQCSSPRNYAGVNVSHEGQNKTDTYEMSTSLRECRWSMHV